MHVRCDLDDIEGGLAMQEVQGNFNSAKIFTSVVDDKSIEQIRTLCDQTFVKGSKIRMMPDVHAGAGCTIGTTMTITDKVVPNLVGVDIGCGMLTTMIDAKSVDFDALDKVIRDHIPFGFAVRDKRHAFSYDIDLNELKCFRHINELRAILAIGSLGGGNHFIEIDKDDEGNLYLVIHSGSRYLGLQAANYYQNLAWLALNHNSQNDIAELIERMKSEKKQKGIQKEIEKRKKTFTCEIPKELAYVEGDNFNDYIHDMRIIQQYADLNRKAMASLIMRLMKWMPKESFTTIHNYIDVDNMILRKGAVSAKKDETLLIPMNMRDGSLICKGLGNADWNESAPHGAGRILSRTQAKHDLKIEDFKQSMEGIYTTTVNMDTIDEAPMVYKSMNDIIDNIQPTVDIMKVIKPIYNFKAPGDDKPWQKNRQSGV